MLIRFLSGLASCQCALQKRREIHYPCQSVCALMCLCLSLFISNSYSGHSIDLESKYYDNKKKDLKKHLCSSVDMTSTWPYKYQLRSTHTVSFADHLTKFTAVCCCLFLFHFSPFNKHYILFSLKVQISVKFTIITYRIFTLVFSFQLHSTRFELFRISNSFYLFSMTPLFNDDFLYILVLATQLDYSL